MEKAKDKDIYDQDAKEWERAWQEVYERQKNGQHTDTDRFSWNRKYLSICMYAILVVLVSTLIIKAIVSWNSTMTWIGRGFAIIAPFIWGAFIAFLINPIVRGVDKGVIGKIGFIKNRHKLRKNISIVISYVLVIFVIVIAFVFLTPQIAQSISDIFVQVPKWIDQITEWVLEFEKNNEQFDFQRINEILENFEPQLLDFSKNVVTNVVPFIFSTSVSVVKVVLNVLIAFIVSLYIISDKRMLSTGFKRILYAVTSDRTGGFIMETLNECYRIFSQFVFGKAIDSAIIGVICLIVMSIMRLPFAPLISLIVGITNMIPYFGPFIGAVPGTILIFMVSPLQALFFIIMIIVLQQVDGLFIGPRILGETVGLRPLWIIFAITIGGSLGGVIGMFLGVPCVAVIAYLMDIFINSMIDKKVKKAEARLKDSQTED